MSKPALFLATGFGLGLSPVASGTTGSLPGLVLALALAGLPWTLQAPIALLLVLAAIPLCDAAEKAFGTKDDGRIVADEYMTFPLCVVGIPLLQHPWFLAVAFVTARAMDVLKPAPAQQAQALPGGVGIVVDDAISGLYALALNHALFWAYIVFLR